jgi:hypothetical protein
MISASEITKRTQGTSKTENGSLPRKSRLFERHGYEIENPLCGVNL